MFPLDSNLNTAIERQADQVRAVQAYGSGPAAAARATGEEGLPNRTAIRATLALAAAAPIALLAWGLMNR